MKERGISLHKIIESVRTTAKPIFDRATDPLWRWVHLDLLHHAHRFQRFYAGDLNWTIPAEGKDLSWEHISGPIGTLAPRAYVEFEILLTIEGRPDYIPTQTRQALFVWGPECFEDRGLPLVEGRPARYVSLEFTEKHPVISPDTGKPLRWVPDPVIAVIGQDEDTHKLLGSLHPVIHEPGMDHHYQQDVARGAYLYTRFLEALTCSNVYLKDNPAPIALNKKRLARGNVPHYSFKTLHIRPSKHEVAQAGEGSHASPRLHFRRGHVRRLQSNRKVWVSSCMVGSEERGIVKKDYELG